MLPIKKTKVTQPDMIELGLVGVLIIWIIAILWLLNKVMSFQSFELLSWTSLLVFIMVFISICVLMIAILLADIRKEIKELY